MKYESGKDRLEERSDKEKVTAVVPLSWDLHVISPTGLPRYERCHLLEVETSLDARILSSKRQEGIRGCLRRIVGECCGRQVLLSSNSSQQAELRENEGLHCLVDELTRVW